MPTLPATRISPLSPPRELRGAARDMHKDGTGFGYAVVTFKQSWDMSRRPVGADFCVPSAAKQRLPSVAMTWECDL